MTDAIWIDSRAAQDPEQSRRGIGRYVLEHTRALIERFPERISGVVCDRDAGLPEHMAWLLGAPQVRYFDQPAAAPAIHHVMSAFEPLWPRERLLPAGVSATDTRIVVTVYDLIPTVLPQYRLSGARASRYQARLQLLNRADHLLCISEFTAHDVQRVLGVPDERITVIGAGVTSELDPAITVGEATADPGPPVRDAATRLPAVRRRRRSAQEPRDARARVGRDAGVRPPGPSARDLRPHAP